MCWSSGYPGGGRALAVADRWAMGPHVVSEAELWEAPPVPCQPSLSLHLLGLMGPWDHASQCADAQGLFLLWILPQVGHSRKGTECGLGSNTSLGTSGHVTLGR